MRDPPPVCLLGKFHLSYLTDGATLPYRLNVLLVIVVTFSTIVAYQKSQRNMHKRAVGHCHRMRDPPPVCLLGKFHLSYLTHGATLPYRLNVLHVIVVTFATNVAYQKSQKNMHNGLYVTVTECATRRRYVYSANSTSADPWRYAAISIECVTCNCGDLFNDRGISIKPEKHA